MLEGDGANFCVAAAAIGPKPKQLLNLLDRESEVPRTPDKRQAMHIVLIVVAVAACTTGRCRKQAGGLVIADHFGRNAGGLRHSTDIHIQVPLAKPA